MFFFGIGNKISQHLRFMKANGNTHLFLKTTPTGMVLKRQFALLFTGMRMMINVHHFRPQCGSHLYVFNVIVKCFWNLSSSRTYFSASVGHSTLIQQLGNHSETAINPLLFYKSSHFNIL
jgi:hypothetical protein